MRITYSHTLEDILRISKTIKEKSGFDLKLVYNEYRGYYLRSAKHISLSVLSDRIEDDVIQISEKSEAVLFSTRFVRKYRVVKFTRPVIAKNEETMLIEGLKTIWTKESKFRISDEINLNVRENKKIVIFQKTPNSF
ncbi:unnamed protein product [Sphagnum compactum]